jgi:hypothetical protein
MQSALGYGGKVFARSTPHSAATAQHYPVSDGNGDKAKVEFIMRLLLRKYVVYFNQLNNTLLERALNG